MYKITATLIMLNLLAIQAVRENIFSSCLRSGRVAPCDDDRHPNEAQRRAACTRANELLAKYANEDSANDEENYMTYIDASKVIVNDPQESWAIKHLLAPFINLESVASAMGDKRFNCNPEIFKVAAMKYTLKDFCDRPELSDVNMMLNRLVGQMANSFLYHCSNKIREEVENFENNTAIEDAYRQLSRFDIFLREYHNSGDLLTLEGFYSRVFDYRKTIELTKQLLDEYINRLKTEDAYSLSEREALLDQSLNESRQERFNNLLATSCVALDRFEPLREKLMDGHSLISQAVFLTEQNWKPTCSFGRILHWYSLCRILELEFHDNGFLYPIYGRVSHNRKLRDLMNDA